MEENIKNRKNKRIYLFFAIIVIILASLFLKLKYNNKYKIINFLKNNYYNIDKIKYKSISKCNGECTYELDGTCFKYKKIIGCQKYVFDVYMSDNFIINGYVLYKNNVQDAESLYSSLNNYKNIKNKIDGNINYSKVIYNNDSTISIKVYSHDNLKKVINQKYINDLVNIVNSEENINISIEFADSLLENGSDDYDDYFLIKRKLNYRDYSSDSVKIYYGEYVKDSNILRAEKFLK